MRMAASGEKHLVATPALLIAPGDLLRRQKELFVQLALTGNFESSTSGQGSFSGQIYLPFLSLPPGVQT